MIKAGIIGGSGYTAGELIRILINHTEVQIDFVFSTSNAGNKISSVHQDLIGEINLEFTNKTNKNIDVLFLCLGHGNSKKYLQENTFAKNVKIVDLSNDFRLGKDKIFFSRNFVYGLPELNSKEIKKANYIANPGCFATAIQLAILPLAKGNLLKGDVHVNATTGATGAGTSLSKTTHFTWRDNNFSSYKVFSHQHLDEINQSVKQLQTDFKNEINFIPNRGNFSRGIYATCYTEFDKSIEEAIELYNEFYKNSNFTFITDHEIFLKQVVNTNKCFIYLQKHNNKLVITSIIDNLLKGASGQAVQNMNLMFGLDETMGLHLKANFF